MKKIINIIIETKKGNFNPWDYKATMMVFGKKRFLTFGDTIKSTQRTAMRRLKKHLINNPYND